ncbi:acyltransferase domain-containing protein [Lipingzhangella sp. LS1_29]|uniref:[acyl-carrier-protein] S-malonyltransferase n=1 Tax=Lipingzhangella rawalii TaxID=2055835 RepID=A0ABU2HA75_9ACTN|nr:acyltransferase domain-containing protein [Lipingzhangella rawalii]MDS1272202.1 acyltransferase domain-containing protein [Lipingzhangella rawalii]
METRTAFLFPGQGSYIPGILSGIVERSPRAERVLATVDEVCTAEGRSPVSHLLRDTNSPSLAELSAERPDDLELVLFTGGVAAAEILAHLGLRADVVAGHSFGEISALTFAGALNVSAVVRLILRRQQAFRDASPPEGGMIALKLDARRTEHLVGLIDHPHLVLAVDNGPDQCVVSGPSELLTEVYQVAHAAGVDGTRLRVAHPFHNPVLREVADRLGTHTADLPFQAPRIPTYSALLGRYMTTAEDMRELAHVHLVRPVRFHNALLHLHRDGVRKFVESGPRDALTTVVDSCLPRHLTCVAPLRHRVSMAQLESLVFQEDKTPSAAEPVPPHNDSPASEASRLPAEAADESPVEQPEDAGGTALPADGDIRRELSRLYATHLELPEELITDDIDLEADLGIDSIKQLEVFAKARDRFGLPEPPEDLRVTSYTTLPEIIELIRRLASTAPAPQE